MPLTYDPAAVLQTVIKKARTPAAVGRPRPARVGLTGVADRGHLSTLPSPPRPLQVVSLDKERFFYHPVTEAVAPGYFSVIKYPMSLSTMLEKAASGQYQTWRALVADVELICSNAVTFNPRRSRVHKAAQQLLKAAKKALQGSELEVRGAAWFVQVPVCLGAGWACVVQVLVWPGAGRACQSGAAAMWYGHS